MSNIDPLMGEGPEPEEPRTTVVETVEAPVLPEERPVREMSQAAVASFVYGTFQVLISGLAILGVVALNQALNSVSQYSQTLGQGVNLPSAASFHTLGTIALLGSNAFGVLGFITGIVGLVAVKNGKNGVGLVTIGLVSSIGCAVVSFLIAQGL